MSPKVAETIAARIDHVNGRAVGSDEVALREVMAALSAGGRLSVVPAYVGARRDRGTRRPRLPGVLVPGLRPRRGLARAGPRKPTPARRRRCSRRWPTCGARRSRSGRAMASLPGLLPSEFFETLGRLHFEAPPMHFALLASTSSTNWGSSRRRPSRPSRPVHSPPLPWARSTAPSFRPASGSS